MFEVEASGGAICVRVEGIESWSVAHVNERIDPGEDAGRRRIVAHNEVQVAPADFQRFSSRSGLDVGRYTGRRKAGYENER